MLLREAFLTQYWFSNNSEAWKNPVFSSCFWSSCLSEPRGLTAKVLKESVPLVYLQPGSSERSKQWDPWSWILVPTCFWRWTQWPLWWGRLLWGAGTTNCPNKGNLHSRKLWARQKRNPNMPPNSERKIIWYASPLLCRIPEFHRTHSNYSFSMSVAKYIGVAVVLRHFPHINLRQGLSLTWNLPNSLGWPVSEHRVCLSLLLPHWGYRNLTPKWFLLVCLA